MSIKEEPTPIKREEDIGGVVRDLRGLSDTRRLLTDTSEPC